MQLDLLADAGEPAATPTAPTAPAAPAAPAAVAAVANAVPAQGGGAAIAVQLAGPTDWAGFVRVARVLVRDGVAAEHVRWLCGHASDPPAAAANGAGADLFDPAGAALPAGSWPDAPPLNLPDDWVALARTAALHADPQRWALIHQLAARLHTQPELAGDPLDPDLRRLARLAQAVRREAHKMKAFVRFRPVTLASGELRHIAWFEPEHQVQERVAPFFARRFTQMQWAILTPRISLAWDGHSLTHGPGARAEDAPGADDGEALWLAYYRSIFNPARVKVAMMKREMPVRYWANLPEARQIGQMLQQAPQRTAAMLASGAAAAAPAERQRPRSRAVDAAVAGLPSTQARAAAVAAGADARAAHDATHDATHVCAAGTGDCTGSDTGIGIGIGIGIGVGPPTPAARQATLAQLARRAAACRGCALADCATQTVWGEGPADARLMLVGEQPGDREDLAGRPFVGPAGQLLRHTLAQLGWDARRIYLTNAVKHFKHELRGKRRIHKTASQQEAAACLAWLEAEIDAVQPQLIVALGATAARSLLGRPVAVSDPAGPWWCRADGRLVLVVLHPAALLRLPDADRQSALRAWQAQLALVDVQAAGAAEPADWRL